MEGAVLVSGASGFVGNRLVAKLLSQGKKVVGLVRKNDPFAVDSADYIEWDIGSGADQLNRIEELFYKHKISRVIHCATLFRRTHEDKDIRPLIESNEILGCYLLEFSSRFGVTSFVNLSSSWQLQGEINQQFNSLYAVSKQAFVSYLDFYAKRSEMSVMNFYLYETISHNDTRDKVFNGIALNLINGSRMAMGNPKTVINLSNVDLICEQLAVDRTNSDVATRGVRNFEILNADDISLEQLVHKFELFSGMTLGVDWGVYNMPTMDPFWRGELAYNVQRITVETDLDKEIVLKLAAIRARS